MPTINPVRFKFMQAIITFMMIMLQVVCAEEEIMCIEREREALLQFKAALLDHYGMLSSWTTSDCCQWQGIRCSNLTGHVLMLDLHGDLFNDGRYMSGEIHQSLMELQQLNYLNLSSNDFQGRGIPEFLGSLTNLRYLDLSFSYFGGNIPTQFGSLSHLKYLDLSWNRYMQGSIPRQLGNLSQLQHLDLSANQLEGNIPSQIGNLYQLQHLDLRGNQFEGNIPSQIGNLYQLQHLDLRANQFEGNIPSQLGNLSNLQKLYLGGPALKIDDGDHWLSNLISLTHLSLVSISNLNTSHSFLQMIAKLPKLRELSLIDCSLSDHFILSLRPSKFNFSSSLSRLDLSWNSFTSSMILQWLSNVTSNLVELDLSGNRITGSLPDLSVFSSLKILVLDMNQLSGNIPEGIRLPIHLESLSIQSNSLEGGIPKSFGNACALRSLYMSGNNLNKELSVIIHQLSGCARFSLQELNLRGNQINGTLPDLSIFSALKTLDLSENQLNEKIPESTKLPSLLESLSITSNILEGGIPKSFGNACALRSLYMSGNNLNKELSMIIHQLSGCARFSLQELNLRGNQINGTLPDLSIFSALKTLDLSENQLNDKIPESTKLPSLLESLSITSNILEGGIPKSFGNACALRSLVMFNNSLSEEFPMIIHHLSGCARYSLEQLSLSMNQINGTLPDLSIFSSLRGLYLYGNKLNGEISKDIKFPPQLEVLDMQSNSLKGVLTDYHFAYMSKLDFLDLSNNHFSGKIPDCWSHFKSLSYLDLSHNNFSGRIPTSMGSLVDLRALLLRNNNLSNEIPFSLRSCTNLLVLDIAENRLSGSIPDWIGGELQELEFLSLRRNHFHGSLPLKICYLSKIQLLDLSLNNMSGQIPKCIKNFTSMTQKTYATIFFIEQSIRDFNVSLMWKGSEQMFKKNVLSLLKAIDLSSNHFSGEIPIEIESLFELVSLNLSRNNLTGKIPSNIGKLTSLDFLDLSRNQLVGSIPSSLTQIDRLGMLDLSHNNLSGEIPTGTQLQSFNASCYEDNLYLCGPPLKKLCIDGKPAQKPIVKLLEDEKLLFTREFYISMTIGFVTSFWGVFGSILIKRSWRHVYFKFLNNLSDNIYVKVAVFANKISKVHG